MFTRANREGLRPALPGIQLKTLAFGERTLLAEFHLSGGATLPKHAHPHEQTGYLVSGRIQLSIGSESFDAGAGDSWCIPAGVEHNAEILEDAVAIEVFSPVREDYLP
jgi:quercetin dioxygenase-like cupin family protein